MELVKPGESTTRGRPRRRPAGLASPDRVGPDRAQRVRRDAGDAPAGELEFWTPLASCTGLAARPDGVAGYHSETISSRAFTPAAQGSGREVSVRYKDVVPTGHGPVGSGRYGVRPGAAGASPAPAEVPMPPIITGRPPPAPLGKPRSSGQGHSLPDASATEGDVPPVHDLGIRLPATPCWRRPGLPGCRNGAEEGKLRGIEWGVSPSRPD